MKLSRNTIKYGLILFKEISRFISFKNYIKNKLLYLIPNHIYSIELINVRDNYVKSLGSKFNSLVLPSSNELYIKSYEKYYSICVWSNQDKLYKYYLLEENFLSILFNFMNSNSNYNVKDIINILSGIDKLKQKHKNKILGIYIDDEDVTHIFNKYLTSLYITDNITADVVYVYYCFKRNYDIDTSYTLKIMDDELNEKEYKKNDSIII